MARIAAAIRADRLSFAFLEASPYRRWAVRSPRTYRAVSEETGIPMDTLASALEAMGFARMGPEEPMREDELEIVPLLQQGFSSGLLDLAWLTRLGRAHADALAETLALLVDRSARQHSGVPVQWLGDGVMVHYREPAGAVLSALDLVAQLPGAGLPPAHVGVAAGPVVVQGGDYFGHTVNLAARIAASAGASRVLVSERVAERAPPQGVASSSWAGCSLRGSPGRYSCWRPAGRSVGHFRLVLARPPPDPAGRQGQPRPATTHELLNHLSIYDLGRPAGDELEPGVAALGDGPPAVGQPGYAGRAVEAGSEQSARVGPL
jgi:hypothetical protein